VLEIALWHQAAHAQLFRKITPVFAFYRCLPPCRRESVSIRRPHVAVFLISPSRKGAAKKSFDQRILL
jgi:hypothetical protein